MKLLCLAQNFHQGWGGGPESIRLLARSLASAGVSVDVYDRGHLHPGVENLELLPERRAPAARFTPENFEQYRAIVIAGTWQHPWFVRRVLQLRDDAQPLIYLPRGNAGGDRVLTPARYQEVALSLRGRAALDR